MVQTLRDKLRSFSGSKDHPGLYRTRARELARALRQERGEARAASIIGATTSRGPADEVAERGAEPSRASR